MTDYHLTAVALSPIHIGDGTDWTPDCFKLDGAELVRFEPAAVLGRMDERTLKRFTAAVDSGNLDGAQKLLRDAVPRDLERGRIAVSGASRKEIEEAIAAPLRRRGAVHPFVRSGGHPILPGSSIKGSIRTAVVSDRVTGLSDSARKDFEHKIADVPGGRSGKLASDLETAALGGRYHADPFRFVSVSDADLSGVKTRIDQVLNLKRDGNTNDMQMHFECLPPGSRWQITLRIDTPPALDGNKGADKQPKSPLRPADVIAAIDRFYRGRFDAEARRFFAGMPSPKLPAAGGDGFPILLRLGRFSHFESASVDELRKGHRPQSKQRHQGQAKTAQEGSTRAVVRLGDRMLTFGWVLLAPTGHDQALEAAAAFTTAGTGPSDRRRPQASAGAQPAPAQTAPAGLVGRRGFVDDEPVIVRADLGSKLDVEFTDTGDTEVVPRQDVKFTG